MPARTRELTTHEVSDFCIIAPRILNKAAHMNTKYRVEPTKKQPPAKLTSKSIDQHTAEFLSAGGVIQYIKSGVSGVEHHSGHKQKDRVKVPAKPV